MKKSRIVSLAGGLVGTAALAAVAIATAPAASAGQSLSGSAFAVSVDVKHSNDQTLVSVPPTPHAKYKPGGEDSVIELDSRQILDESDGVVSAKALNAASKVSDDVLTSRSSVADLLVKLKSPSEQLEGALSLSAELVVAKCSTGPDGLTGSSQLANVSLLGYGIVEKHIVGGKADAKAKMPAPNTTIGLPGLGKIVLNEQIKSGKTLTVNAIHVYLKPELKILYGDIIVSQAVCSTGGGPAPTSSASSPAASPSASTSPGEPTTPGPSASTEPGGGGGGDGDLPTTGFKLLTFASIGAALVAAGMAMLWFMRRRKEEAAPEAS